MKNNNQSTKHSILNVGKDTLVYIPAKLFPALFSLLSVSIYTRIFSPADYGDYSLIMTTIGIIGIFAYSWLNISNLRFFSIYRNNGRLENFFSTSFFILIVALICSFVIFFFLSKFSLLPLSIVNYLMLTIGVIFSTSLFDTIITIFRADRKTKAVSFFISLSSGLCLAISLLLIYALNFGISAILISYILINLILSAVLILRSNFQRYIHFKYFSKETLKEFLDFGVPLILTLLFSWILALSDRYIIEYFRGSQEVGIYSAVYQLAGYPISMITSILVMAAYPILMDTWEKSGDESTKTIISEIVKYYLILSIPILFGIVLFSQEIVSILGSEYAMGVSIVPWVAIGAFSQGLDTYTDKGLELKKKTKYISLIMFIAGIGNIAMNFILVPRYGFYGAGVSTALSYFLYLGLTWVISWKFLPWKFPSKTFINCIVASILMGCALLTLKYSMSIQPSIMSLLIFSTIGGVIYFIALYFTGELKNQIEFIKYYFKTNFLSSYRKNKYL